MIHSFTSPASEEKEITDLIAKFEQNSCAATANVRLSNGTPLLFVVARKSPPDEINPVLLQLYKHGGNFNIRSRDGLSLLHLAISLGNMALVKFLIEKVKMPLHILRYKDATSLNLDLHQPIVTYLKEKNAEKKITRKAPDTFQQDETKEKIKTIKKLLKEGYDPDEISSALGDSAFLFATKYQHLDILKLLYKNFINVEIRDNKNYNALLWSIFGGNLNITKWLVETANVDINALVGYNKSLLHFSIIEENEWLVSYLVNNGADTVSPDRDGNTPLHIAATITNKITPARANITLYLAEKNPHLLLVQNNNSLTPIQLFEATLTNSTVLTQLRLISQRYQEEEKKSSTTPTQSSDIASPSVTTELASKTIRQSSARQTHNKSRRDKYKQNKKLKKNSPKTVAKVKAAILSSQNVDKKNDVITVDKTLPSVVIKNTAAEAKLIPSHNKLPKSTPIAVMGSFGNIHQTKTEIKTSATSKNRKRPRKHPSGRKAQREQEAMIVDNAAISSSSTALITSTSQNTVSSTKVSDKTPKQVLVTATPTRMITIEEKKKNQIILANIHYQRGMLYLNRIVEKKLSGIEKNNLLADAAEDFLKSMRLNPSNVRATMCEVIIRMGLGDYKRVINIANDFASSTCIPQQDLSMLEWSELYYHFGCARLFLVNQQNAIMEAQKPMLPEENKFLPQLDQTKTLLNHYALALDRLESQKPSLTPEIYQRNHDSILRKIKLHATEQRHLEEQPAWHKAMSHHSFTTGPITFNPGSVVKPREQTISPHGVLPANQALANR